jgi:hypothetical protein
MNDWQIVVLFFAAMFGSIFAGLIGYAQAAKEADKAGTKITFKWFDLVITGGSGFVAGGLYILGNDLSGAAFGAAAIITGIFAGAGVGYTAKKTILNP